MALNPETGPVELTFRLQTMIGLADGGDSKEPRGRFERKKFGLLFHPIKRYGTTPHPHPQCGEEGGLKRFGRR